MSEISQLLPTWFWPNFKGRSLGLPTTTTTTTPTTPTPNRWITSNYWIMALTDKFLSHVFLGKALGVPGACSPCSPLFQLCIHWIYSMIILLLLLYEKKSFLLSKPKLNPDSTQPNVTLSFVRHENDFAHHPPPHKLNVANISAVTDPILMKL